MIKKKFYVVWKGRETGVFDSWAKCKELTDGYPQAQFKSFTSLQFAEEAFRNNKKEYAGKKYKKSQLSDDQKKLIGSPILDSISVDGAWNTRTGIVEYKGVYTKTGEELFLKGPFVDGTNNIVEFLAIVHALAYCKQKLLTLPVYSDSRNAIGWVKNKQAKTNHPRRKTNEKLFELIDRAIKWLNENSYPNKILKWETRSWGENPADFGRK